MLRKSNAPWAWTAFAFFFNLLYNELLLWIPDTTASLMSGDLSSEALWGVFTFYGAYTAVMCVASAIQARAEIYSVRRAREALWRKMLRVNVSFYDQNDPAMLMSAITTD